MLNPVGEIGDECVHGQNCFWITVPDQAERRDLTLVCILRHHGHGHLEVLGLATSACDEIHFPAAVFADSNLVASPQKSRYTMFSICLLMSSPDDAPRTAFLMPVSGT